MANARVRAHPAPGLEPATVLVRQCAALEALREATGDRPLLGALIRFTIDIAVFSALFLLLAPVSAVLGVVFSSIGMSRRHTRRGLAIAGLVIGIIALLLGFAILVSALASG